VCKAEACRKALAREYSARYAKKTFTPKPAAETPAPAPARPNRVADALRRANDRLDRGDGIPHDLVTGQALRVGSADE
jgi:hypothetical protein